MTGLGTLNSSIGDVIDGSARRSHYALEISSAQNAAVRYQKTASLEKETQPILKYSTLDVDKSTQAEKLTEAGLKIR